MVINHDNIKSILGKPLYVTPTGVKVGSKGKVTTTTALLAPLVKSQRRQIRKALREAGFIRHAGN